LGPATVAAISSSSSSSSSSRIVKIANSSAKHTFAKALDPATVEEFQEAKIAGKRQRRGLTPSADSEKQKTPKRRKLLLQPSTPKPARRRRLPSEVKIVYSNLESCVQQAVSSSLSSAGDAFRRKKFRFKIVDFPTGLLRGYFCARDDCSSALKDTWQDGTYCCWNGHQGDQCAADWDTRDLLVTDVVSDTDAMVSFNVKSAKALWGDYFDFGTLDETAQQEWRNSQVGKIFTCGIYFRPQSKTLHAQNPSYE
jgi:hypothetical protein